MTFEEDMIAEGEPEHEFNPGIAARLPRKRVAAGALFRRGDRILLVEPIYKPTWEIPGGVVDENESPLDACEREIFEELGLRIKVRRLLVVDWVPAHGVWGDGVMFIFDGGTLSEAQLESAVLQQEELKSARYLTVPEAEKLLRPSMARRIVSAVEAAASGQTLYLQFGRQILA